MKKIGGFLRKFVGIFFIVVGIFGTLFGEEKIFGILTTLLGISFLPIIYEKISILNKRKKMQLVLPIVIFILTIISTSGMNSSTNNNSNVVEKNEIIETNAEENIMPQSLNFEENEIEIDINETKRIVLNVEPSDANIENLELKTTNDDILKIKKDDKNENKLYLKINPSAEGTCEVYAKINEIESNKIKVRIVDNERIEKERKAAEEQAKKEEEGKVQAQLQKEAEQSQTKQASSVATQQTQTNKSTGSKKSSTSQTGSSQTNSRTVYVTPTGKRYHYSSTCGGKNSTATTIDNAKARGLTPCKKCAQ